MSASMRSNLREKLRAHFGFTRFRPGQAEAVRSAIDGRDTLVVMPTGSGKSLCFQLPAVGLEGTAVVVSPLIALMKDQVDSLRERDIPAVAVNSTLSASERKEAEQDIAAGRLELIYTTPEQLSKSDFRAMLKSQHIDLFIVDEAHCASHWGHDFRPEYLTLAAAIDDLGRPPVLAVTATASGEVIEDILTQLRIPDAEVVHTGFHRTNLHLSVLPAPGDKLKRLRLLELLEQTEGTGIIYTATVKAVGELTEFLEATGLNVAQYHGRLAAKRRAAAQDAFMADELKAIVATNAFGLGIDKPNVRFVVHYHTPGTLDDYYQEIGRAGRDGETAWGTLLYDPADRKLQRFFQGGRYPEESDLVNAYHAIARLHESGDALTQEKLQAVCPLTKTRLKVCLNLFVNRNILGTAPRGKYRLLKPDLSRAAIAQAGESYRERHERDLLKLEQMVEFAEQQTCRWDKLVNYLGKDDVPGENCGHCDNCTALQSCWIVMAAE